MFPLTSEQVQQFGDAWGLHPGLTVRILWTWWQAHNLGIRMTFVQGHRSNEEQAALYAQGRTAPGPIVTNAKAGESKHNQFPSRAIDVESSNQKMVAQLAKSVGLEWGGDWHIKLKDGTVFTDPPHFQWNT